MTARRIPATLTRYWRVAATGLVFVLFGLGAVVISVSAFPVLRLSTPNADHARRRIQRFMQLTFKFYMNVMRGLGILTYSVNGLEELRAPGRLIVANHPTLLDVVFLVSLLPEVDCIVKRGLWRNPFLRWPVLWASYIPNSEGEELIERCAERIRRGHSLLVFPEGTRAVPGQAMHMQRGAARIALAADAEITPVTITCEPITLFKSNPWYRVPARRFHLQADVGTVVTAAQFRRAGEPSTRSARRLTQWLLHYYQGNGSQTAVDRLECARPISEQAESPDAAVRNPDAQLI
jgi:1-acyl-sn-glycerol-3-phosphate acyltransferase